MPTVFPLTCCVLGLSGLWVQAQTPAPASPAKDPALAALEARFAEDRAAALRRVLARYVDELEALEKSLAMAGDASGAARARLEHDRVLPALGLPALAGEDADDFSAFEDPPVSSPLLPVPVAATGDLNAILNTLRPAPVTAAPNPAAGPARPLAGGSVKGSKRVLRMGNAQLNGTWDSATGYKYWYSGRTTTWTLKDLAPGSYNLVIRYACDEKDNGGGKLKMQFGSTEKREEKITGTGGWKRRREITIGPFEIKESQADLVLEAASKSSYLWDLVAVLVQPAGAVEKSGPP